jgi:hypothetical protein
MGSAAPEAWSGSSSSIDASFEPEPLDSSASASNPMASRLYGWNAPPMLDETFSVAAGEMSIDGCICWNIAPAPEAKAPGGFWAC